MPISRKLDRLLVNDKFDNLDLHIFISFMLQDDYGDVLFWKALFDADPWCSSFLQQSKDPKLKILD